MGIQGTSPGWGCHCGHTALILGGEFYPWLVQWRVWWLIPSFSQHISHSPVNWNQSLAAIITAIKSMNALHSGNIFYLLGFEGLGTAVFLGKCCLTGQVQLFLASLVLFLGEVCSRLSLGLCRELCSDKVPVSGSSFALVFPLFWLCPVLSSLSPEWEDILDGRSSIAPGLFVFGISCSGELFPEDLLKLRLLERSPRSGFTCPSP